MKKLIEIVKYNAAYLSDVEIKINTGMGWITIIDKTGLNDYILLDGNDGYDFIEQATHLYNTLKDVTLDECYKHLAKPYIDCIWS